LVLSLCTVTVGVPVIAIDRVVKQYGGRRAIDALSLEIPAGRIFGLLGPNGAGKTTLLRMIMGLVRPDTGAVTLFGGEAPGSAAAVRKIGYMPQQLALYEDLTVHENLMFFGRIYGLPDAELRGRAEHLLHQVDLEDRRESRVGTLSGGMMRRAMLASALMHRPALLILDEPTAGVDPLLRIRFWNWFVELAEAGTTLLITTHHISEADRCQEIAFQRFGRILRRGRPADLLAHYGVSDLEHAFVNATQEAEALDVAGSRSP
jgi:ABC-2 type transport system ATP-binding protein